MSVTRASGTIGLGLVAAVLFGGCSEPQAATMSGLCTLELVDRDGGAVVAPYEARIGVGGVARIRLRGAGWRGELGTTQAAPNGWKEFGSMSADAVNDGGASFNPNQPGLWQFSVSDAAGCSARFEVTVLPPAQPASTLTPTASPARSDDAPTPRMSAVPTSAPPTLVPSPTAEGAPTQLTWTSVGPLGGPSVVHGEDGFIDWFVGFAGGYLAAQRTVGSDAQWANRVWFSPDGDDWQLASDFDPESQVAALATDGEQVLALVLSLDDTTSVWQSADGLNWRHADIWQNGYSLPDWTPWMAWSGPGGWHVAMIEEYDPCGEPFGCSRVTIFRSKDGLAWQRLGDLDANDPLSGVTTRDGTLLLVASYRVHSSTDDGVTWRRIKAARDCLGIGDMLLLAPSSRYGRTVFLYGGETHVCGSTDRKQWEAVELPGGSTQPSLRHWLVETDKGLMTSSDRYCLEDDDCRPTTEQFFSTDGRYWSRVEAPADLEAATEMSVADGPRGVIGLSYTRNEPQRVHVWRLTGGQPGP